MSLFERPFDRARGAEATLCLDEHMQKIRLNELSVSALEELKRLAAGGLPYPPPMGPMMALSPGRKALHRMNHLKECFTSLPLLPRCCRVAL